MVDIIFKNEFKAQILLLCSKDNIRKNLDYFQCYFYKKKQTATIHNHFFCEIQIYGDFLQLAQKQTIITLNFLKHKDGVVDTHYRSNLDIKQIYAYILYLTKSHKEIEKHIKNSLDFSKKINNKTLKYL